MQHPSISCTKTNIKPTTSFGLQIAKCLLVFFAVYRIFAVCVIDFPLAIGCQFSVCNSSLSGICSTWCTFFSILKGYLEIDTITSKNDVRVMVLMMCYSFIITPLVVTLTALTLANIQKPWVSKLGIIIGSSAFFTILQLFIEWGFSSPSPVTVMCYNFLDLFFPMFMIYFYTGGWEKHENLSKR
eukprot:TRINITY_DN4980_c0_g1_i1.p1 TRINITY_DN4980_c0_g1~~TRINITY_DN4980_c0_g1_i1.p1  ORF type:complete len:185 (-),score=18.93 TRINITY_DN4980_c0_g1_i1:85-639(-)